MSFKVYNIKINSRRQVRIQNWNMIFWLVKNEVDFKHCAYSNYNFINYSSFITWPDLYMALLSCTRAELRDFEVFRKQATVGS